jgi:hypothetical protein
MRDTFDVTNVMNTITAYKLKQDKIEKILYTGECNNAVTNLNPMPDGRGILEIYYKEDGTGFNGSKKNQIDLVIGQFKQGKRNGYVL